MDITTASVEVIESKEEEELRKFREAVKDAEKATLIFNLNMGNVPIMNQETISKKATLALTTMATLLSPTVTPGTRRVAPFALCL